MKKKLLIIVLISFITIKAQEIPRFEIGVIFGEPTSLSMKWWYGKRSAIDAAAGWAFGEGGRLDFHTDYLLHVIYPNLESGELPIYLGIGLSLRIGEEAFFGGRIPFGIEYIFKGLPMSIFAEIAPIIEVPENKVNVSGGLGIRLNFGTAHKDVEDEGAL